MGFLTFIDTNILLDFYRIRGGEKNLSILDHVGEHQDRFIITSQVEMEFKKNRQKVILDSYSAIKPPDFESLAQLPAFLLNSKQSSGAATAKTKVKKIAQALRVRTERVLQNPTTSDPVYKAVQRLFTYSSPYNLNREKKLRYKIRRLARKRFLLGYPPRKSDDTSMGDAINWEWIIHCATESGENVVIVTRDTDYGAAYGSKLILNDWLAQEFHKRVSKKRKLILTDRLAEGLKSAGIGVTKKEIEAEEEFLETQPKYGITDNYLRAIRNIGTHGIGVPDSYIRAFEEARKTAEGSSETLRQLLNRYNRPNQELQDALEKLQRDFPKFPFDDGG